MIDNNKEIRWKQRFSNFEKSFNLVSQYINRTLRLEGVLTPSKR
jgi:hypothetical protein